MSPKNANPGSNGPPGEGNSARTAASFTNMREERQGPGATGWDDGRLVGTTIGQHYQVLELVGHGGMSAVYKAVNILTKRVVAVKVMQQHLLRDAQTKERFRREAISSSRLNHPHCISVYDMGFIDDDCPYLVMDFLQGESLAQLIERSPGGRIPVARFLNIFKQAASAIAYAHEHGILHRDLKPGNIMIVQEKGLDCVKIVDFGIAKIMSGNEPDSLKLTKTGDIFGSPLYMSPEQCQGLPLDARSDIYSVGCTMYEALSGRAPLEGSNMMDTLYKQTNVLPAGLNKLDTDSATANAINAMVMKSLSKKPNARQQTMQEMMDEIAEIEKTFTRRFKIWNPFAKIQMTSRDTGRSLSNFVGGRWTPIIVFGALFFLAGIVAVALWLNSYQPPPISNRVIPLKINLASVVKSKYPDKDSIVLFSVMDSFRIGAHRFLGTLKTKDWYGLLDRAELIKADSLKTAQPRWDIPARMYKEAIAEKNQLESEDTRLPARDIARMYSGAAETQELGHAAGQIDSLGEGIEYAFNAVRGYAQASVLDNTGQEIAERGRLCRLLDQAKRPSAAEYRRLEETIRSGSFEKKQKDYRTVSVARAISQVGDYLFNDKDYADANEFYLKALQAWSACEDSEFNVAATENQLGMCCEFMGDASTDSSVKAQSYFEATKHLSSAARMLRAVPGDNEQFMVGILYNQADVLWRQCRWLAALWVENTEARKLQMDLGRCTQ